MSEDHNTETAAPPAPPGLGPSQQQQRRNAPALPRIPINPLNPNQAPSAASTTGQPPAAPNATQGQPSAVNPQPPAPGQPAAQPAQPGQPTPPGAAAPAAAGTDAHDHGAEENAQTNSDSADGQADDKSGAGKSPFNPEQVGGIISPLVTGAMGVPTALMGAGMGLLSPLMSMLGLFGQGDPAQPGGAGGLPAGVLNSLGGLNAADGATGMFGDNYQSEVNDQARQAGAIDHLDKELRKTLEDSASNSKLGRNKIEQIINQVKSQIQAMGPVSNTAAGQMGIIGAITQAITQAGAVVSDGVGKDSLNAGKIKSISLDYLKDLNDPNAGNGNGDGKSANPGGGVDFWIQQALAANGITDPRAVANWLPGMRTLIARESGGNPKIGNYWDSNAKKGTPSLGLCQTIRPTFDSHWRPGTPRDILNPVSNTAAAIHYIMSRYGVSASGFDLTAKVQQADSHRAARGY